MSALKHDGMKRMGSLAFAVTLAGCTAPMVAGTRPAPEGSSVALGQPVQVGRLVATPKAVVEDSRCPENARCIWAGRLIVSTQIDGPNWRETIPLTLGEAHATHDTAITLVSGTPEKRTGNETFAGDYRFTFEGGN